MSRDNDVFKVLVTKGNKAVLGPNLKVDALTDGQIGVFNADTNMSIDGNTAVKQFYIGVGVVGTDGTLKTIRQSSGNEIQTENLKGYTFKPHTAGRPMIVEVSNFKAQCDSDYALKIEFINSKIWRNQGFNQYSHTFNVRTACCTDCADDCNTADQNEVIKLLAMKIQNDNKKLVKAEVVTIKALTIATHATSVDYAAGALITNMADIDKMIAFNKLQTVEANKVYAKLRLTSLPLPISSAPGGIDLKYYNQRETTMIVSLVDGFGCGGTITTTQQAAYEEGNGYDIQQREYKTLGWQSDSGAYRTSAVTGLATGTVYYADANQKYDKIVLEYQHEAQGGWLDYKNELATEIAIPEADTTTRNGLLAVLDKIAVRVGFDALADDAALANVNAAIVETVEELNDVTKDGIN